MDDETFRALQEQAHQLTELEKHPGWPVLVDFLLMRAEPDKLAVLRGTFDDIAKYHKVTGKIGGIHFAIDAPETVRQMVAAEVENRAQLIQDDE